MRAEPRELATRDRAWRRARALTFGGWAGALGLTGAFSTAAAFSFSGHQAPAAPRPPAVPVEATPWQHAPPPPIVITRVVHRPAAPGPAYVAGASAPAPPRSAPAPAPPAPPACISTPSHPC